MVLLSVERALNEARKELEREAQKKAEKALSREKQKMQKELESLRKGKQKADDEKRQADEARLAAENAKAIADAEKDAAARERDRLQAESSKCKDVTINEFLKRLQRRPRDSDSDSDDDGNGDGQPRSKRSKSQSSEFDSDGALVKIPKYEGQNLHGLVLFKRVSADIQQLIGQNKFFPLEKMYTGDEITTSQIGHVTVTTTTKNVPKKITNKSELFYLLYNFGQYYLQLYPEKASSFLEYCAFLTKICDDFTAQSLVELDNLIRKEYVTHPQWNWDQTNAVIDKLYLYFAREKSNLKSDSAASASSGVFPSTSGGGSKGRGKPKKQAYFQYQSPLPQVAPVATVQRFVSAPPPQFQGHFAHPVPRFRPPPPPLPSQGFPAQQQFQGKKGKKGNAEAKRQAALLKNPNIVNERCSAHNFSGKGCSFGPSCLRLHVCFNCGDPSHRVKQCPHPQQYGG